MGEIVAFTASRFVGSFVGMAAVGGLYGELPDKGVGDELMKLAGNRLEEDGAAVFVLATDGAADRIAAAVAEVSDQYDPEVGDVLPEAQKLAREALELESCAR